jgi:hypothetical protein
VLRLFPITPSNRRQPLCTDMEQLFQLSGEGFDIEELARLFARGSVTVKKIEDNYYLQLPGWESPLEEGEALEAGKSHYRD